MKYEIRIVIDGEQGVAIRSIPIDVGPEMGIPGPGNSLKIYVTTKESLTGERPRTTFDKNLEGEKFLRARIDEIDRALEHSKKDYENLDPRSSYKLRWKTTLNYGQALHKAAVWYHYVYLKDARHFLEMVKQEYKALTSKWFWQPKLTNIGITESDFLEPLRDIEAFELQKLHASYFLNKRPAGLDELTTSMGELQRDSWLMSKVSRAGFKSTE
jgi:hypothetical protein